MRRGKEREMTERPIIFSGEMVRAIMDRKKVQTRRPIKPQPNSPPEGWYPDAYNHSEWWTFWGPNGTKDSGRCTLPQFKCPFGKVGDRLWVRETWSIPHPFDPYKPSEIKPCPEKVSYHADRKLGSGLIARPSIHMPRWASRILLEITDIRVERVQEINCADAEAEGTKEILTGDFTLYPQEMPLIKHGFAHIWDSIYAKKGFGWESNPFVWVIDFRRIA